MTDEGHCFVPLQTRFHWPEKKKKKEEYFSNFNTKGISKGKQSLGICSNYLSILDRKILEHFFPQILIYQILLNDLWHNTIFSLGSRKNAVEICRMSAFFQAIQLNCKTLEIIKDKRVWSGTIPTLVQLPHIWSSHINFACIFLAL